MKINNGDISFFILLAAALIFMTMYIAFLLSEGHHKETCSNYGYFSVGSSYFSCEYIDTKNDVVKLLKNERNK